MNDKELELWILDTIEEGGYSFQELSDYISRSEIKSDILSSILNKIILKNFINIYEYSYKTHKMKEISIKNQKIILSKFNEILKETGDQKYHFQITKSGISYLRENGIYGA